MWQRRRLTLAAGSALVVCLRLFCTSYFSLQRELEEAEEGGEGRGSDTGLLMYTEVIQIYRSMREFSTSVSRGHMRTKYHRFFGGGVGVGGERVWGGESLLSTCFHVHVRRRTFVYLC